MSTGVIISIIVSLISLLLCAGFAFLLFCLVLGFVLLRRRGKKQVTATEAVSVGVERVSSVFRRNADGELVEVSGAGDGEGDDEAVDDATE